MATTKYTTDDECPNCGTTYGAFRCYTIASYSDAYHQIAWTREHTPSRRAVLSHWARCKSVDFADHVEHCGDVVECPEYDDADFADDDFADFCDDDFVAATETETTTEENETMTTTNHKNTRAIDFRCPKCDARRGRPCKGSRIPSANSLGGGWGGPVDRTRPHDERYAVRRAAIALDVTPAEIVTTHVEPEPTPAPTTSAASRTRGFDFVNDSFALVVQDAPEPAAVADDEPAVDTRTLSLFDADEPAAPVLDGAGTEYTRPESMSPADVRDEFARGWREWCGFGFVDVAACTVDVVADDGGTRAVECSKAFRDGYAAAARDNDAGGSRPTSREASEAADEYVAPADNRATFVATVKTEDGTSTHTVRAATMRDARDWIFEIFPGISHDEFDVVWSPRIGDGAHSSINGDAYPFTVTEVSASGHRVVARRDRVARVTDGRGAYVEGHRDALFTVDPEGAATVFTRRQDGTYRERGCSYVFFGAGRATAYNPHV